MSEPAELFNNFLSLIEWTQWLNAIDVIDQARIGIDLFHHETHDGNAYTYPFVDEDVDIAAPKYILLRTPDTAEEQHLTISVGADDVVHAELYEAPTINVDGTPRTLLNRNRRSTNTANTLLFEDPTVGADGVLLGHMELGGTGVGQTMITGEASQRDEFILKRNEDYIVKVTATADNTHVNIQPDLYEVTPP